MNQSAAPWRVIEDPVDDASARDEPGPSNLLSATPWLRVGALALAATLGIAAFVIATAGSHPSIEVTGAAEEASSADASERSGTPGAGIGGLVVVDVQGAVVHPGVVRLVAGSRVGDAIAAAGGYGPRVDASRVASSLNLAAALKDGDQVVVPSRDDRSPVGSAAAPASGGGRGGAGSAPPLDLNSATSEQLDALPGIGPVTAAKILAARDEQRFSSVDDLRTRKLVGAATFDKIKDLLAVG